MKSQFVFCTNVYIYNFFILWCCYALVVPLAYYIISCIIMYNITCDCCCYVSMCLYDWHIVYVCMELYKYVCMNICIVWYVCMCICMHAGITLNMLTCVHMERSGHACVALYIDVYVQVRTCSYFVLVDDKQTLCARLRNRHIYYFEHEHYELQDMMDVEISVNRLVELLSADTESHLKTWFPHRKGVCCRIWMCV